MKAERTTAARLGKAYIRILGRQLDRFVEFEFILNDEMLSIELVMPDHAFEEFVEMNGAEIIPNRDEAGEVVDLGERNPGLYRAPGDDPGDR